MYDQKNKDTPHPATQERIDAIHEMIYNYSGERVAIEGEYVYVDGECVFQGTPAEASLKGGKLAMKYHKAG